MLTTSEVAEMLGVTSARVRQMVLSGELEGEKKGRDVLITQEAAEAAKLRKTKPGPSPKLDESPTDAKPERAKGSAAGQ